MRESNDENDAFVPYACAYCGEPNEVFVDHSAGNKQQLVEDCAVCCRPNVIRIFVDSESGSISINAEFEG
ncbi:MAG TPA: CPXCG motif-containing cysteine-rich protein [Bacteroidota bacterium]